MRATSVCLVAALWLTGCVDRSIGRVDPTVQRVEQKLLPVSLNQELDLLFVIDGCTTRVDLHQGPAAKGRRPRCDSYESRNELGAALAAGGLHTICRQAIADEVPHSLSRRAFAGLREC